jgi:hypothetical protein
MLIYEQVQTFLCVPLADQGGLVEWVLQTQTYNSIVRETYRNFKGLQLPGELIKDWQKQWHAAYNTVHAKPSPDSKALMTWIKPLFDMLQPVGHMWWLARCVPWKGVE